jgi:hypothetical protein
VSDTSVFACMHATIKAAMHAALLVIGYVKYTLILRSLKNYPKILEINYIYDNKDLTLKLHIR